MTECLELGVPLLVYPVANHWEQHYVAAHARRVGQAIVLSRAAIVEGQLARAILRVLGDSRLRAGMSRPQPPAAAGQAAATAARALAAVLGPPAGAPAGGRR